MSAIDELFKGLKASGQKALMPFVSAGDPDLEFTAAVLSELAARGCHLFEVGVPYSDPIADGSVIQASYTRALENKIRLSQIFDCLRNVTSKLSPPVVTMVSYSIVHRHGVQQYVDDAVAAGTHGMIVPDLPVEESGQLADVCKRADISLIQLVTPATPRQRALRIVERSTGFLYYVSVVGITGEREKLPAETTDNVSWLREQTDTPICIGFGISQPEHVQLLSPVADGLIVGSAFVRRIAKCGQQSRQQILQEIGEFSGSLLAALD